MAEAFAYGLASPSVLTKLQGMLLFNSVVYITAVVVLSGKFGIVGLIYANCVNMVVRAGFSLKISLDTFDSDSRIGLISLFGRIFTHKAFVGLVFLGCIGTAVAHLAME